MANVYDIRSHMPAEKRECAYSDRLRAVSSEFLLAEKRERQRIAMALNEGVAQILAVSKMKLGALCACADSPDVGKSLKEIRSLIELAICEIRSLTFEISPPVLYELGLEAAIEWLAEDMSGRGIQIKFEDDRQIKPVNEAFRVFIFQAVREVLANIVRHSQWLKMPQTAKVSVRRDGSNMRIEIENDGIGPGNLSDLDNPGLFCILECLNYIGGYFEIESESSGGSRIILILPLEQDGVKGHMHERMACGF